MALAGILANTYGNIDALADACDFLLGQIGAEKILHLGNFATDVDQYISRLTLPEGKEEDLLDEVAQFLEDQMEKEDLSLKVEATANGRKRLKRMFIKIRGHSDPNIPELESRHVEVIADRLVLLTAEVDSLGEDELATAEIICTSQWSRPLLRRDQGRIILCPGHLSDPDSSHAPTFATVEVTFTEAKFCFYNLKLQKVLEKAVPLKGPRFTAR